MQAPDRDGVKGRVRGLNGLKGMGAAALSELAWWEVLQGQGSVSSPADAGQCVWDLCSSRHEA